MNKTERSLLDETADYFQLGTILEVKKTPYGIGNDNFFVTIDDGQSYVFRMLWTQTIEGLKNEIAIGEQLALVGIKTPQLLKNIDGKYFYQKNEYNLTATKKIEGVHPDILNPGVRQSIGRLLGTFHQSVTTLPINTPQWLDPAEALREVSKVKLNTDLKKEAKKRIEENRRIFDLDLPSGIIHGDLYSGNLLLTPENELVVFDFETAERNLLIVDIARALLSCCIESLYINDTFVGEFLKGYEEVRALAKDEKMHLKEASLFVSGAVAGWLLNRNQDQGAREFLTLAESWDFNW